MFFLPNDSSKAGFPNVPAPTVQKISKSAATMTPWKNEALCSRSRSVHKPKQNPSNRRDFCKDPAGRWSYKGASIYCGERLAVVKFLSATEYIFVVSSDSSKLSGGRMPGSAFASRVLPLPGGPIMILLCYIISPQERYLLYCLFF